MNSKKSIYEIYISSIYRWGLLTLVCASLSASVFYTTMKLCGFYAQVSWTHLLVFDLMDLTFFFTALFIIKRSIHNGALKKGQLWIGKTFTFVLLVIQWNYILYMIPSGTFWGFFFFFTILTCFFLDIKLIVLTAASLLVSLYISGIIHGQNLFYSTPDLKRADLFVLLTSIVLSIIGIIIFILFMTRIQWMYKKREQQLALQKKFYFKIIKKETGFRQFRHDIKKHIMALEALCEEEDFAAVKNYVKGLSELEIQTSRVHTGNVIADCFINDLIDELQKKGPLAWQVIGKFPDEFAVSENDLCVILGNAAENAKEALLALPPEKEKRFFLTIKHYQEHIYLCMKNTAGADSQTHAEGPFASSKSRSRNHGLGLANIKMTVDKYGGSVEWKWSEELFTIQINI